MCLGKRKSNILIDKTNIIHKMHTTTSIFKTESNTMFKSYAGTYAKKNIYTSKMYKQPTSLEVSKRELYII